MNPRVGNGAMEAAAVVDERNGPLAHNGLENASRFPQAPTAQTDGLSTTATKDVHSEQATPKAGLILVRRMGSTSVEQADAADEAQGGTRTAS
jgi:hypothetical protein